MAGHDSAPPPSLCLTQGKNFSTAMQRQEASDWQVRGLESSVQIFMWTNTGSNRSIDCAHLSIPHKLKPTGEQDGNRPQDPSAPSRRKYGHSSNSPKKQTQYMYSLSNQALREKSAGRRCKTQGRPQWCNKGCTRDDRRTAGTSAA